MELADTGKFQPSKTKNDTSLVEMLAALIIGGISMYAALLGLYLDNPILFGGGVIALIAIAIVMVSQAIMATFETINTILDFMDRIRERRKRK